MNTTSSFSVTGENCVTHWFVFDGGAGYTQVQLSILLNAGIDQGLDWSLFLEQQEGITWNKRTNKYICKGEKPCDWLWLPPLLYWKDLVSHKKNHES